MFVNVDDNLINLDDVSLIVPCADNLTIGLCHAGTEAHTTIQFPDLDTLISAFKELCRLTNASNLQGVVADN